MSEDDLKHLFDKMDNAPIRESAKARAMALALGEFKAVQTETAATNPHELEKNNIHSQGISHSLRPTDKSKRNSGSNMMQLLSQKWFLGGVATACTVLFGVILFNGIQLGREQDLTVLVPSPTPSLTQELEKEPLLEEEIVVSDINDSISSEDIARRLPNENLSGKADKRLEIVASAPLAKTPKEKGKKYTLARSQALPAKINAAPLRKPSISQTFYDEEINPLPAPGNEGQNKFDTIEQNSIKQTVEEPVSTFSIDVDTASYSFVRRQLNRGVLPSKNAVRLEELLNYFDYDYPLPQSKKQPFQSNVTITDSPWKKGNKLVHIGIKGYDVIPEKKPPVNLVFLLDVSGSMRSQDKLPLVKQSMNLLLNQLAPEDTVAIAVYAGAAGTVLEPTQAKNKQVIINALNKLQAGGSTAGAEGIKLAYQLAEANFNKEAVNRIILATDGDFNVGINDTNELKAYVERKRQSGVFLSVLGFGDGNYQDQLMQALAQNGNGVAAYIDTLSEAQKVLVNEVHASLFPIAKDVKIQVEFNPQTVSEYRLLGYETRALAKEDFNNDAVDAGEIGSGHTVTAIYEITPVGSNNQLIDESRYAKSSSPKINTEDLANEYGFLKIRYKLPNEHSSKLISTPISRNAHSIEYQSEIDFSIAVAGFAELLRGSKFVNGLAYDDIIKQAQENKGADEFGYRTEFIQLVRKAKISAEM